MGYRIHRSGALKVIQAMCIPRYMYAVWKLFYMHIVQNSCTCIDLKLSYARYSDVTRFYDIISL